MQFQSDMLGATVRRPVVSETTALGAAYLAGLAVGYWQSTDEIRQNWQLDRSFAPTLPRDECEARYRRWLEAVRRSSNWEDGAAGQFS